MANLDMILHISRSMQIFTESIAKTLLIFSISILENLHFEIFEKK